MRSHHGAIQQDIFHIRIAGKVLMHIIPDIMFTPAGKTLVNRVPLAIIVGHKPLLRSAAGDPEDAFDKKSAIRLGPSVDMVVFLQEKVDLLPLVVS
jgi:hypothetical protein